MKIISPFRSFTSLSLFCLFLLWALTRPSQPFQNPPSRHTQRLMAILREIVDDAESVLGPDCENEVDSAGSSLPLLANADDSTLFLEI